MASERLELFAVAAPGLEPLVAGELRTLGVEAREVAGGVEWGGGWAELAEASLRLRTATRIVVRAASFHASSFAELERRAKEVPWARWIASGASVRMRVTTRKSKLWHQRAVAERLLAAIDRAVGGATAASGDGGDAEEDGGAGETLLVVRVERDLCTVSVDASGEALHRRGYRQQTAKAPLRETLAAAMLVGAGWDGSVPLVDPFCGSGTIPIEAALIARRIAPGIASTDLEARPHAWLAWPDADVGAWEAAVERARAEVLPRSPVRIVGSDRDAGAIAASDANAARAGVAEDVEFAVSPVSAAEAPGPDAWAVTNPPYGRRVRGGPDLRNLYAALGRWASSRIPDGRVVLLSADQRLDGQTGLTFDEVLRTRNGGIPVRVVAARPGGR